MPSCVVSNEQSGKNKLGPELSEREMWGSQGCNRRAGGRRGGKDGKRTSAVLGRDRIKRFSFFVCLRK